MIVPLVESGSKEALHKNIGTEIKAGRDPKQAAAIAYSVQREHQHDATGPAVETIPEQKSLSEINESNRKYWGNNK